jgi:hypothetical protein
MDEHKEFATITKRYSECFHKGDEKIEKFDVVQYLEGLHDYLIGLVKENKLCICFSEAVCKCNKECFCMDYNFFEVREVKMELTSNCQYYIELITNNQNISVPKKNKKTINIFHLDDETQEEHNIIQVIKYVQQMYIYNKPTIYFDIDEDNITFKNGKLCILFNYMQYTEDEDE